MTKIRTRPVQEPPFYQRHKQEEKILSIEMSRFILYLMRFQQCLGLCPVSLHCQSAHGVTSRINQRLLILWTCLTFVFLSMMHIVIISNHSTILYNEDSFGKVSDLLKLAITMLATQITFWEVLKQRSKIARYLQIYSHLQRNWSNISCTHSEALFFRQFLIIFTSYQFLMLSVEITYGIERIYTQAFYFHMCFMPSVILCRLRLSQIMFLTEMLRNCIENFNSEIQKLVNRSQEYRKNGGATMLHNLEMRTHRMMQRYEDIFEMSTLLKNSTKFSLTAIYAMTYIKMLTDCYWSVWLVNKGHRITEFILLVPTSLNIFQLLFTSRNCMNATTFLPHNIHRLRHFVEDLQLSARIQNLSLQLRHQQITIDAFGLLIMNCYIVKGILASIATYMLVFKQILPKFTAY